jgi:hypothetical protein
MEKINIMGVDFKKMGLLVSNLQFADLLAEYTLEKAIESSKRSNTQNSIDKTQKNVRWESSTLH